jgi:glycyl-tRNA synthetase beta chain
MNDLLLEIGCENLPPAAIRPAFEQLRGDVAARFAELRLPFRDIYVTGAPRRIVLIVSDLAVKQTNETETVTGPPVSKGFDDEGRPTRAAIGFAGAQGVLVDDLKRIPTERGEYLGITRKLKSRRSSALLREALPELIKGLRFPKMMHWESGEVRFARPIRWLVCLLGDSVIHFELTGVRSGATTFSVPWIRHAGIRVKNAEHYLKAVRKAGILLDHKTRYATIGKLARRTAAREKLELVEDPGLFTELTFMLEEPRPLAGTFDKKYLALPDEVVITAMKSHQRYLALRGRGGKLVPMFITFTEGRIGSPKTVRAGNEKVLRARLEDAMFYWHEDVKTGLDGLSDKLGSVVFLEGMGTLRDKSDRVCHLARFVNDLGDPGASVDDESIERAALVAKADLASEMIKDGKEFTLLQGMIGSYYAEDGNEPAAIVRALREQYLPRFGGDELPASELGALLSVADRVDTIAGCFLAGLAPTGSQDPYALRRQANGLVRILETRPSVRIDELVRRAVEGYADSGLAKVKSSEPVMDQLAEFFKARAAARLKEQGIAYDIVGAVSAVAWAVPGVVLERARAFQELRGNEAFELLITGAKRVSNILEPGMKLLGVDWPALKEAFEGSGALSETIRFDAGAFTDDPERHLADFIKQTIPGLIRYEKTSDSRSILGALSELGPAIDDYFDRVLVNCPDAALRTNRHNFLAAVYSLFSRYADFSHIVEEGSVSAE